MDDNLIKVLFARGERGWVLRIPGTDLGIINNIPSAGIAHFGDVVRLSKNGYDDIFVEEIVLRQYDHQMVVRYPKEDAQLHCDKINRELRFRDCVTEGMVPGMLAVAFHEGVDVNGILAELGYPQGPSPSAEDVVQAVFDGEA